MKTLKQILDRFDEFLEDQLSPYPCQECGLGQNEEGEKTTVLVKKYISQSIKDALEACRVEKGNMNDIKKVPYDPSTEKYYQYMRKGWNDNTTQYDENVKEFLGEEEV